MLLANCKHKCFFGFSEMQIYVSILLCKHLNRKQLIINKKLGPYKFWVIALSLNGHWVNVSKKLKKTFNASVIWVFLLSVISPQGFPNALYNYSQPQADLNQWLLLWQLQRVWHNNNITVRGTATNHFTIISATSFSFQIFYFEEIWVHRDGFSEVKHILEKNAYLENSNNSPVILTLIHFNEV